LRPELIAQRNHHRRELSALQPGEFHDTRTGPAAQDDMALLQGADPAASVTAVTVLSPNLRGRGPTWKGSGCALALG
jgi:hypothetical protein